MPFVLSLNIYDHTNCAFPLLPKAGMLTRIVSVSLYFISTHHWAHEVEPTPTCCSCIAPHSLIYQPGSEVQVRVIEYSSTPQGDSPTALWHQKYHSIDEYLRPIDNTLNQIYVFTREGSNQTFHLRWSSHATGWMRSGDISARAL